MFELEPIGYAKTPFEKIEDMPIQPKGAAGIKGSVIIDSRLIPGLKDLEGFSHVYLIYHFHKAAKTSLSVTPFMDTVERGVFSTRSPLRPNHIGLSIVELGQIEGNVIHINGIDLLNDTPILDIKPYIQQFDRIENSCSGWMQASEQDVAVKRSDARFR